MTVIWKIFSIANIAEILVVTSLIGYGLYTGFPQFENSNDYFFFGFIISIPMLVTLHCIGNILLLSRYTTGKDISLRRKIGFWILTLLFLGLMILLSLPTRNILLQVISPESPALTTRQLLIFYSLVFSLIAGMFVLVMRIILFYKIRNRFKRNELSLIEELGR